MCWLALIFMFLDLSLVVGFDQSRVDISPSDAGRRYSFTADVLLSTPGAPDVTGLDYAISREPAMPVNSK